MLREDRSFYALGTDIEIRVIFENEKERESILVFLSNLEDLYIQTEKKFSRFNKNSELSEMNRKIGLYSEVSKDFLDICKKSLKQNRLSEGFFDPRILTILESIGYDKSFFSDEFGKVKKNYLIENFEKKLTEDLIIRDNKVCFLKPMDFSGIVKGWITDKASDFLKERKINNFLINSGGDMTLRGADEEEKVWTVDLEGFSGKGLVFEIKNFSIATSGITRRKWEMEGKRVYHLVNPKDYNNFPTNLKSVTVVMEKTEDADIMAKTLFLMGKEKGLDYSQKNKIKSAFLDSKGNVIVSSEIKKIIIKNQ